MCTLAYENLCVCSYKIQMYSRTLERNVILADRAFFSHIHLCIRTYNKSRVYFLNNLLALEPKLHNMRSILWDNRHFGDICGMYIRFFFAFGDEPLKKIQTQNKYKTCVQLFAMLRWLKYIVIVTMSSSIYICNT